MSRTFKTVDYEAALDLTVRLGDCLPPDHLARFVVDSVGLLDLSAIYARYGSRGGEPYAPEVLLALILYGYATGVFSSRKIERATYEAIPFRYIAGHRLCWLPQSSVRHNHYSCRTFDRYCACGSNASRRRRYGIAPSHGGELAAARRCIRYIPIDQ